MFFLWYTWTIHHIKLYSASFCVNISSTLNHVLRIFRFLSIFFLFFQVLFCPTCLKTQNSFVFHHCGFTLYPLWTVYFVFYNWDLRKITYIYIYILLLSYKGKDVVFEKLLSKEDHAPKEETRYEKKFIPHNLFNFFLFFK